jgi:hypothetical protein
VGTTTVAAPHAYQVYHSSGTLQLFGAQLQGKTDTADIRVFGANADVLDVDHCIFTGPAGPGIVIDTALPGLKVSLTDNDLGSKTYTEPASLPGLGYHAIGNKGIPSRVPAWSASSGALALRRFSTTDTAKVLEIQTQTGVSLYSVDHFGRTISNAGTPSIVAGPGSGTAASVSISGTDLAGVINYTVGTGTPTAGSEQFTVTFNNPYPAKPVVTLTPAMQQTAVLANNVTPYVNDSTSSASLFKVFSGSAAMAAGSVHKWYYQVMGL